MTTNGRNSRGVGENETEETCLSEKLLKGNDQTTVENTEMFDKPEPEVEIREQETEVVIEEESSTLALDGGWGWWVVLGSVLTHTLIGGLERSAGVVFLIFQERYQESAAATAWVLSLASATRLMAGPLTSALCQRYSHRSVVITGGIIAAIGIMISGFAPNIPFLYFSYGFVRGIGCSFAYAPAVIIVGLYFHKRRGMAVGLATAGVGIGTFAIPPFTEVVFDYYGFLGLFFIHTGYILNLVVCGSLFRPLGLQRKIIANQKKRKLKMEDGTADESFIKEIKVSFKNDEKNLDDNGAQNDTTNQDTNEIDTKESMTLMNKIKARRKSSAVIIKEKARYMTNLLDIGLLKNYRFCTFCIAMFVFTLAFQVGFVFLPPYAKQVGLSDIEAAYTLSVAGVLDTLGRICAGTILDLKVVKPYRMFIYTLVMYMLIVVCVLIPFMKTFLQIAIVTGVYGLLTGTYISQKSVIIVDLLGPEKLTSSFGLMIWFQGLGMLIGPPIAGMLKDSVGRYDEAFYFGAASIFVGAICLSSANFVHYIKQKRKSES